MSTRRTGGLAASTILLMGAVLAVAAGGAAAQAPVPRAIGPTYLPGGRQAFYPHGGWAEPLRYYYLAQLGFGRYGPYSWYYGRPYDYPYAAYYGAPTPTPPAQLPGWPTVPGTYPVLPGYTYPPLVPAPIFLQPPGTFAITHLGGRVFYQFQPMAPFDIVRFGPWATYRLNPYGAAYLAQQAALAQALQNAWMAGFQQARERLRSLQEEPWGAVVLRIDPPDALLYVDGNPIGSAASFMRAGAELLAPPGKLFIEAWKADHRPFAVEIEVRTGERSTVEHQLKPGPGPTDPARAPSRRPGRPTGSLSLAVTPPDAAVYLDGHFVATANLVKDLPFMKEIPAGPHLLTISRDGYRTHREELVISPLRPLERKVELSRE